MCLETSRLPLAALVRKALQPCLSVKPSNSNRRVLVLGLAGPGLRSDRRPSVCQAQEVEWIPGEVA
jgi:hypothetical protein